ncbi:glycosyltransferase [Planomicrobium chinense]|uniref:glycosyltransferase family 2 protein n=1 Tax=Planococcus chinensis TaxID=272917 RepID=UPI001CC59C84|nr:glycosyltransferase [Planococcus chinensis]MBZ5202042.1 glycosyltransferase [Planococcus chinensis]
MCKPKVSIIMGIYNCEKYLSESIDSILHQTFEDWNLIMCDDGSMDRTYNIARDYMEKYPGKIVVIKNKKNMGLNFTLNKCLEIADGKYIARQDGDDISEPTRLEKEVSFLDTNIEFAFVGTDMTFFDSEGGWGCTNVSQTPKNSNFIKGTPFCHATTMVRKEIFDEVEGYTIDSKLLRVEDYHLWFKIYSKGYKGYNIKENLYKMRDDRDATNRKTFKNRINETRVKWIGFRMLNIPYKNYIFVLRPFILAFVPSKLYEFLHRNKKKATHA